MNMEKKERKPSHKGICPFCKSRIDEYALKCQFCYTILFYHPELMIGAVDFVLQESPHISLEAMREAIKCITRGECTINPDWERVRAISRCVKNCRDSSKDPEAVLACMNNCTKKKSIPG